MAQKPSTNSKQTCTPPETSSPTPVTASNNPPAKPSLKANTAPPPTAATPENPPAAKSSSAARKPRAPRQATPNRHRDTPRTTEGHREDSTGKISVNLCALCEPLCQKFGA